jgi:hypothetical protein
MIFLLRNEVKGRAWKLEESAETVCAECSLCRDERIVM